MRIRTDLQNLFIYDTDLKNKNDKLKKDEQNIHNLYTQTVQDLNNSNQIKISLKIAINSKDLKINQLTELLKFYQVFFLFKFL
jgi:hypothetical protein